MIYNENSNNNTDVIIYYVRTRLFNFFETRKLKSSRPVKQPRDFNNG